MKPRVGKEKILVLMRDLLFALSITLVFTALHMVASSLRQTRLIAVLYTLVVLFTFLYRKRWVSDREVPGFNQEKLLNFFMLKFKNKVPFERTVIEALRDKSIDFGELTPCLMETGLAMRNGEEDRWGNDEFQNVSWSDELLRYAREASSVSHTKTARQLRHIIEVLRNNRQYKRQWLELLSVLRFRLRLIATIACASLSLMLAMIFYFRYNIYSMEGATVVISFSFLAAFFPRNLMRIIDDQDKSFPIRMECVFFASFYIVRSFMRVLS